MNETKEKIITLKSGDSINLDGIRVVKLIPSQGGHDILSINYYGDSKDQWIHDPEKVKEAVQALKKHNVIIES